MLLRNRTKHLSSTILLVACFWPRDSQQQDVSQPEVTIPQGTLQGTTRTTRGNRTVSAFLAIPYAQPPIGDLRFANPVAAEGWNGTREASLDGSICTQVTGGVEDCLNINVYTPQLPENSSSTLLPVLVWIHGGGYMTGSPESAEFGPEYMLDADVVLAAPYYRLGPFGFLSTGDEVASGNWGLKDQILALQWVQNNIEFFGGDPDRVTIAGNSAGASSVHLLTLSDATIGLFHKYIIQSGSALAPWAYQARATYVSRAFELGGYVGCPTDTSASLITCLRGLNASDIVATYPQFYIWRSIPAMIWLPTDEPDVDGAILTDSPENIFAARGIRDLPWMAGVVRDEGNIATIAYYQSEDTYAELVEKFDTLLPNMMILTNQTDTEATRLEAVKSYYLNNGLTGNRSEVLANFSLLMGDAIYYYPVHAALQQQLALTVNPRYYYMLNYKGTLSYSFVMSGTEEDYGIIHTDDLIYLFEERTSFPVTGTTRSESDLRMVDTMVELWTSFVENGTPTTTANNNTVTWEPYSTEHNYLQIGNNTDLGLDVKYNLLKERMEFWASLEHSASSTSYAVATRLDLRFAYFAICSVLYLRFKS